MHVEREGWILTCKSLKTNQHQSIIGMVSEWLWSSNTLKLFLLYSWCKLAPTPKLSPVNGRCPGMDSLATENSAVQFHRVHSTMWPVYLSHNGFSCASTATDHVAWAHHFQFQSRISIFLINNRSRLPSSQCTRRQDNRMSSQWQTLEKSPQESQLQVATNSVYINQRGFQGQTRLQKYNAVSEQGAACEHDRQE